MYSLGSNEFKGTRKISRQLADSLHVLERMPRAPRFCARDRTVAKPSVSPRTQRLGAPLARASVREVQIRSEDAHLELALLYIYRAALSFRCRGCKDSTGCDTGA